MLTDRRWVANPGKRERPKDPEAKVWLKFRAGHEPDEPRRAGNYNWLHRDEPFDIMFAASVEGAKPKRAAPAKNVAPATPSPSVFKDGPEPTKSPSPSPPSESAQGSLL